MIEPLIQAKFGPVVLRNRLSSEYWRMSVRSGDTVFYDPTLDTLVHANGWLIADDIDLMYMNAKKRFVVGVRYSVVQPLYTKNTDRPGEARWSPDAPSPVGPPTDAPGRGGIGHGSP